MLQSLLAFVEDNALADAIRENDILFPLIESIHVVAISLVVGSILAVDLRLVGLASVQRPVSRVTAGILPLTWCAFVVAVASGGLLFISNATKYLENGYFLAKMALIALAGANMLVFHFVSGRDMAGWDTAAATPARARLAGGLSILIWIAVVACGRWIGFTMKVG